VADHPRLAVLKALTEHLEGITVDDGFAHDLDGKVFRGRLEFGNNDPVPMLSIIEAPKPDAGAIYGGGGAVRHEQWDILLQGWASDDVMNPTDPLYPLLTDVEARLAEILLVGDDAYMLPDDEGNPRFTDFKILPPVVRPPSTTPAAKACFLLPLRIGLALGVG
jgi:hypothetical protein